MKVVIAGLEALDDRALSNVSVDGVTQAVIAEARLEVEVRDLPQRVNARVCSSSTKDRDGGSSDRLDRSLQRLLDRAEALLALPAKEL